MGSAESTSQSVSSQAGDSFGPEAESFFLQDFVEELLVEGEGEEEEEGECDDPSSSVHQHQHQHQRQHQRQHQHQHQHQRGAEQILSRVVLLRSYAADDQVRFE